MTVVTVEQLNARAGQIGSKLLTEAIRTENREMLLALRDEACDTYGIAIRLAGDVPDFNKWYQSLVNMNATSRLPKLDVTGEFSIIMNQFMAMDLSDYYRTTVLPLFVKGPAELETERDNMLELYDAILKDMVDAKRSKIGLVC